MAFLTITNISKKYQNRIILNNINLSFNLNEFVCIVGPSGSGKTTLLSIIGLIETTDHGNIQINNRIIKKNYDKIRYDYIGFIYQNYQLISYFNVKENITLGNFFHNNKELSPLLEELNLLGKEKYSPSMLSGGEQQRVAIARCLYKEPKIILADEPTGALDSKNAESVMRLLKNNNDGRLIIMVTHNEKLALKYATRIIRLNNSKIIEDVSLVNVHEIERGEPSIPYKRQSFKDLLTSTLKSYNGRKKTPFAISIIATICFICILATFSFNYGLNKYSTIIKNIKLDSRYFEFDYFENGICTENTEELNKILISNNISFLSYDNYNFLLNSFIKPQLALDIDFTFSVIDFNLINNNQMAFFNVDNSFKNIIVNTLFKEQNNSLSTLKINGDFNILSQTITLDIALSLDCYIDEGTIYNTPKIYLDYTYVKSLFDDQFINYFFYEQKEIIVGDYILILSNIDSCLDYLKNNPKMNSFLSLSNLKEQNCFIYNSSSLVLKETLDNLILSIKQILLISIILILISTTSLLSLILTYSLKKRNLEVALLQSFGANKNDLLGLIFSEAVILILPPALTGLLFQYILSKLCYKYSPKILNQNWYYDLMPIETLGITALIFTVIITCFISSFFTFNSISKNTIKGVLQDE